MLFLKFACGKQNKAEYRSWFGKSCEIKIWFSSTGNLCRIIDRHNYLSWSWGKSFWLIRIYSIQCASVRTKIRVVWCIRAALPYNCLFYVTYNLSVELVCLSEDSVEFNSRVYRLLQASVYVGRFSSSPWQAGSVVQEHSIAVLAWQTWNQHSARKSLPDQNVVWRRATKHLPYPNQHLPEATLSKAFFKRKNLWKSHLQNREGNARIRDTCENDAMELVLLYYLVVVR